MSLRIEVEACGGPGVLVAVEREPADPGPGEVRVAVSAAGVGTHDLLVRAGTLPRPGGWPYVPGHELVGMVEAVGPGTPFHPGERVIAVHGLGGVRPGGYQARAVVPAAVLAVLPRTLSDLDAAALGLPAITAWLALRRLGIEAGQRLLVHPGTGPAGRVAVRLGRIRGAEVVATGADPSRFGALMAAGADEVLNVGHPDWTRAVLRVERALVLGCDHLETALEMVAADGRLLLVDAASVGAPLVVPAHALLRGISLTGWSAERITRQDVQEAVDTLARFVERGLLPLPPVTSFPLAEAATAHAALEAGHVGGRVILRP